MISSYKNEDLSILKWVQNLFSDAPFIKVIDAFPKANLTIPTVSVDCIQTTGEYIELGSREFLKTRIYSIDVFAKDRNTRDEYLYRILDALENSIPIYDYNVSFETPELINYFDVKEFKLRNLEPLPEAEVLYYRGNVYLGVQLIRR